MIFVTVGSQKFQFNRLLEELDNLVEKKIITKEVFAQTGYSGYKPKHYKYKNFLDREEFSRVMESCDTVITHGGTGAIIGAVKKGKKTIAIPRLKEFQEHVDDHQIQIVEQFNDLKFVQGIYDIKELKNAINNVQKIEVKQYISNTQTIIDSIEEFLQK